MSINGIEVPVNTEWLTDEQMSALGTLEDEPAAIEKIREFYDALEEGDAKKMATRKITDQCYAWLPEVCPIGA